MPTRDSLDELRAIRARLLDAERLLINTESEFTSTRVAQARAILARQESALLRLARRIEREP